jgi:glycosyltransferase involved in cell wall biosynthesis
VCQPASWGIAAEGETTNVPIPPPDSSAATARVIVSVIVPTHNPHSGRLRQTLRGLREQTLPAAEWETIVIDNCSTPPVPADELIQDSPANLRIVREAQLGLTFARRRGFREARGDIIVMVDDDNVLDPHYLEIVLQSFAAHPRVGALGGKSVPEFEVPPPAWTHEFIDLLALRDLGPEVQIAAPTTNADGTLTEYPSCAPIGAGMALRRAAVDAWLQARDQAGSSAVSDRRGSELTSGGDNDIVLCTLRAGWAVGYFPNLRLTHLIPASRVQPDYLARLNLGIQRSWVRVLALHGIRSWPAIARWTVPFRAARAWLRCRAWQSHAAHVRYCGLKGRFLGQADLSARSTHQ